MAMTSLVGTVFTKILYPAKVTVGHIKAFHSITNSLIIPEISHNAWSLNSVRTMRNKFPKPREVKRIKVHGYWTRLQTTNGKKTLMRRILKGRHFLAHLY